MITFATKYNHTDLRNHISRIEYQDNVGNSILAQEIKETCNKYGIPSRELYIIFEEQFDLDEGTHIIPMNADDFLFIHEISNSIMLIELEYTPSTIIRMAVVDGVIKLYCINRNKRTDSQHFANWSHNAWQASEPHHNWLLHCVTSQCSQWLHDSFQSLKKTMVWTNNY